MLCNKTFGAAAIHCMILYLHFIGKIIGNNGPSLFQDYLQRFVAQVLSPIKKITGFLSGSMNVKPVMVISNISLTPTPLQKRGNWRGRF